MTEHISVVHDDAVVMVVNSEPFAVPSVISSSPSAISVVSSPGPAGLDIININTITSFNGILKGNGSTIAVALPGADFAEPLGADDNYVTDAEKSNLHSPHSDDQDLSELVTKTTTINGQDLSANVIVTKEDIGLGNVDNTSDQNKPVSIAIQTALNLKVDVISGKGLSTNDYTTLEKGKLFGIEAGAEVNINADWNATSGKAFIENKPVLGVDDHAALSHLDYESSGHTGFFPSTTSLADLSQDSTHRSVTDIEKGIWNSKSNLAIGETSFTAYVGDKGKTAYDHSQTAHAPTSAVSLSTVKDDIDIADAISKKHSNSLDHVQGTDQGLDTGGSNAVTAIQAKTAYTHSQVAHAPVDAEVNVQADWNASSGDAFINNKPLLFSGSYTDLSNKPSIPASLSQLADDSIHRLVTDTLIGSWNGKQPALGFTAENVSYKSTDINLGVSDTLYPSQKAVKNYVDNHPGPPGPPYTPYNYIEKSNDGAYLYYGFYSVTGTIWKIKRKNQTTGVWMVASGSGDFDTAWADRANKGYGY